MRRVLILALACIACVAACSGPVDGQSEKDDTAAKGNAATSPAPSAPPTFPGGESVDGNLEGAFSTAEACEMADLIYPLDERHQKIVRDGMAAERRGDTAGVAAALKALEPLFSSTAATFADTAAKVADPAVKTALNTLADASAKATLFTSFAEFDKMAGLTAPAEAVLKVECPKAGYPLKNIE